LGEGGAAGLKSGERDALRAAGGTPALQLAELRSAGQPGAAVPTWLAVLLEPVSLRQAVT